MVVRIGLALLLVHPPRTDVYAPIPMIGLMPAFFAAA